MSQIEKLLNVARGELGVKESPANSNNVKYNTWFYGRAVSGSDYPWCCAFVAWCFEQAGLASLWLNGNPKETAYCPYVESSAKAKGQWVTKGYQPGDIVLYDFSGAGQTTHVGIVESVNHDGSLVCIEGNTSMTSNDNGGCVMRRSRMPANVRGAYRPGYQIETETTQETEEKDMTADQVKEIIAEGNPVYNTVADVPDYWRDDVQALVSAGVIKGDGVNPVAMSRSELKSAIVAKRLVDAAMGK